MTFDVELLGDCDTIVSELCARLGDGWTEVGGAAYRPATEMQRHEAVTPPWVSDARSGASTGRQPAGGEGDLGSGDLSPASGVTAADTAAASHGGEGEEVGEVRDRCSRKAAVGQQTLVHEPQRSTDNVTVEPQRSTDDVTVEPQRSTDNVTVEPQRSTDDVTVEPQRSTDDTAASGSSPSGDVVTVIDEKCPPPSRQFNLADCLTGE